MASAPPETIIKAFTQTHVFLYRISGGKVGKTRVGMPVLLLTTTGRKSGKSRTTPLVYLLDGDDYLIAASKGGYDPHPAWYFNLKATPEVGVEIGSQTFTALAKIAEGGERDELYERFKSSSDNFVQYEQMAQRTIPVVRLTPQ